MRRRGVVRIADPVDARVKALIIAVGFSKCCSHRVFVSERFFNGVGNGVNGRSEGQQLTQDIRVRVQISDGGGESKLEFGVGSLT